MFWEEARCPNIAECWERGTATFQILGETSTRACRDRYVDSGKPEHPPDLLEPLRLAQAAKRGWSLTHVVVTSVDRDDLPGQRRSTLRGHDPRAQGEAARGLGRSADPRLPRLTRRRRSRIVLGERPEVFNHNIETVRRLHRKMRGAKVDYDRALWLLARAKEAADYPVLTKSGIIVGLGETNDEVLLTLLTCGCTASTSSRSASISSLSPSTRRSTAGCTPTSSACSARRASGWASAPSSRAPSCARPYRADEQRHAAETGRGAVAY